MRLEFHKQVYSDIASIMDYYEANLAAIRYILSQRPSPTSTKPAQ